MATHRTQPSPAERVAADPMEFMRSVYRPRNANEGIHEYYRSLSRGAEEAISALPYAFVSMNDGRIYDIFRDYPDCFTALAYSIQQGTATGMCTRPRKRPDGSVLYPCFFDMDIYSSKQCTPDDFHFMLKSFLCPAMREFFDDEYHGPTMAKTHFAVYYPKVPTSPTIALQTKTKLICGLCETAQLYKSMENMEPYAECKSCKIRFACTADGTTASSVSPDPLMFSKPHLIELHKNRMPFANVDSVVEAEPWTRVTSQNWDPGTRMISFEHGAVRITSKLRPFDAHIDKTSYKYGVHVTALNCEWIARERRRNIGLRRSMDLYIDKMSRSPKTPREATLKYLGFVKKQIVKNMKRDRKHISPADIQTQAASTLPLLFLTEHALTASDQVQDLYNYFESKVNTLIFDKPLALALCDFLASRAIQWQETLDEDNFWKDVGLGESFDDAVYTAGLRVPYARKILKCVHVRHKDAPDQQVACLRCGGSGKYEERDRPPNELQMIVDAQGNLCEDLCRYLQTNMAGQLASTTIRLPIMGSLRGTIVKQTGHMIQLMSNIPRTSSNATSKHHGIPNTQIVTPSATSGYQAFLGRQAEITDPSVIVPLQDWIRTLRPEWAHLQLKKLRQKRTQCNPGALPQYWVTVDPRSTGSHNCAYSQRDHSGGGISFLIQPPKSRTELDNLHGKILYYCWSAGCDGKKCPMRQRKKSHLPKSVVLRVWDPTSFVTSAGRLGDLAPTLAAISRRQVAGGTARIAEIRSLAGQTKHKQKHARTSDRLEGEEAGGGGGAAQVENNNDNNNAQDLSQEMYAFSNISDEQVIGCHALLYKQHANLCKPIAAFAEAFTALNQ